MDAIATNYRTGLTAQILENLQVFRSNDAAWLEERIRAGFDVHAVTADRFGLTALHISAIHDHPAYIPVLVAAGANVNARAASASGHTPLHSAANKRGESLACIAALLAAGADPNLTTLEMGRTPLHFAATRGDVRGVAALLAAGADTEVAVTVPGGYSPLASAAMGGNPNALPTLLRGGAKNCIEQIERELQQDIGYQSGDGRYTADLRRARAEPPFST